MSSKKPEDLVPSSSTSKLDSPGMESAAAVCGSTAAAGNLFAPDEFDSNGDIDMANINHKASIDLCYEDSL